ncbi:MULTISPECIES: Com family DNA-binding transcriptional regulator [unclassified Acidovorax]|uniref:Com family DNA-binding transcriptional regulator n=1 Tax=unclassified Acidovorax TaxID=2684926 RepID=UPI0009EC3ACE|nr:MULTISPECIES: Com family DNA-binding transcriptional regulator [unclassified Acidovorax]
MEEIRCGHCARKLAEAAFVEIAIKCPRCGTMNHLRAVSPTPERQRVPPPMKDHEQHSLGHTGHTTPRMPPDRRRHYLPRR